MELALHAASGQMRRNLACPPRRSPSLPVAKSKHNCARCRQYVTGLRVLSPRPSSRHIRPLASGLALVLSAIIDRSRSHFRKSLQASCLTAFAHLVPLPNLRKRHSTFSLRDRRRMYCLWRSDAHIVGFIHASFRRCRAKSAGAFTTRHRASATLPGSSTPQHCSRCHRRRPRGIR